METTLTSPINSVEKTFNDKLGHSEKICRCDPRILTQIISVLIIMDSFFFFLQTFFRWGAPCFLWWNSLSTTITFFTGHVSRVVALPVGMYAISSIQKQDVRGTKQLFYFLLFASFISALDIFVSISEVHNVCTSNEINLWNDCSHEWGKQEYKCIHENNSICSAFLTYDSMEEDKQSCLNEGCQYVKNHLWIKPECCSDSMWNYHNPCSRDPVIRNKIFDTDWCENFSDLYDIGIQIITSSVLFGFAYVVNSYTIIMEEGLRFTPNPMDE